MTLSTKKVPRAAIEQVRKAIQNAPDCATEAVPRLEAIRALVPDIQDMQSKGYDWKAIASLLSDNGIGITIVTLKSYLQRAKARRVRSQRKRSGGNEAVQRRPRGSRQDTRGGTAKAGESRTQGRDEKAPKAPADAPQEASARTSKAGRISAPDPVSRPWSFVPEEDTDDIGPRRKRPRR